MNVLMPQLGETVAEGTVAKWHKQVGDKVAVDDVLFDVETDTFEKCRHTGLACRISRRFGQPAKAREARYRHYLAGSPFQHSGQDRVDRIDRP